MVHGIRPGVLDSLICVKKSFLMNTDHLDGFFFFFKGLVWDVSARVLQSYGGAGCSTAYVGTWAPTPYV